MCRAINSDGFWKGHGNGVAEANPKPDNRRSSKSAFYGKHGLVCPMFSVFFLIYDDLLKLFQYFFVLGMDLIGKSSKINSGKIQSPAVRPPFCLKRKVASVSDRSKVLNNGPSCVFVCDFECFLK